MWKQSIMICLAACDLGPRVDDVQVDADVPPAATSILPAGSDVPSISNNTELVNQIRINDGLADGTLMMNNNVIVRSTGKSAGATVRFWNFGPAPVQDNFAIAAPLYILGRGEGAAFVPLADHLPVIDTLCGDVRYSAVRRVLNVPVTDKYKGELITSVAALDEALERGLVGEPAPDGTWVNLPVVVPGTLLELGGTEAPLPAKPVFGRGYRVDVFELGTSLGRQPLRNGLVPVGQASGLQTGVATGNPPTLPTAIDAQLVFQFAIPTMPPGTTFSYSPLATDVTVRLATGVAPSAITADADLFRRSATGAVTAFLPDNVATFTVGTVVNNLQLQLAEGAP